MDAISFSAHADFPQTSEFVDLLNPPHVVLVHGEVTEMMRLKKALEQRAKANDQVRTVHTPKNAEIVTIHKKPVHLAKVGYAVFVIQLRSAFEAHLLTYLGTWPAYYAVRCWFAKSGTYASFLSMSNMPDTPG